MFLDLASYKMDFSMIPISTMKQQKKSKKMAVVTVTEISERNQDNRHFFEQARAYDVIEPLVPRLISERKPKLYTTPYFGALQ